MKAKQIIFEGDILLQAESLINSQAAARMKRMSRQSVESIMKRRLLDVYEVAGKKLIKVDDWKNYVVAPGRPRKNKAQAVTE